MFFFFLDGIVLISLPATIGPQAKRHFAGRPIVARFEMFTREGDGRCETFHDRPMSLPNDNVAFEPIHLCAQRWLRCLRKARSFADRAHKVETLIKAQPKIISLVPLDSYSCVPGKNQNFINWLIKIIMATRDFHKEMPNYG